LGIKADPGPSSNKGKRKQKPNRDDAVIEIQDDNEDTYGRADTPVRRQKSKSSTGNDQRKIHHMSTGQGFSEMGDKLGDGMDRAVGKLVDRITEYQASTSTSDLSKNFKAVAVSTMVKDEQLSDDELFDMCRIFKKDPDDAKFYLALEDPRLHTSFVQRLLVEYRDEKYGTNTVE
jgi:hypothetical protein